jgi:formate dehydrogenase major subunit
MGSNMAEAHPVGFQWVMEARERGAKVIHVDPRFTRTSAMATSFVPIRAGTDIAFIGGLINYVLTNGREFREYVQNYTNAATIIVDTFRDTEDLDGLFSGYDETKHAYDNATWQYRGVDMHAAAGDRHGRTEQNGTTPERDPSLEDPRCVFQLLKRHFARYTPEAVAEICGIAPAQLLSVAEQMCANSGRERTTAIAYAVGWTHHSVGVQYIRSAAILQLLLGNIGRPGGGILALRGHASIQGSTDIPTLYDLLPGYLPMPEADKHGSLAAYLEHFTPRGGYWGHLDAYAVSLLKAYYGDAAQQENDFCFGYVPRLTGNHSTYETMKSMIDGKVRGFFCVGENPATGSANGKMQRKALGKLEWLVVRDLVEIESASFWYNGPEIATGEQSPETIGTEVFFMPAAAHTEKDGSVTNTQRLLQWHHKAVEARGDARSELWFYYHLGRIIREKLEGSTDPRDRAILDLTWDYPTSGDRLDPDASAVLREISGFDATGKALSGYGELKADGSTTSGCWIYCGVFKDDVNQAARRKPGQEQTWVAPEWGWAWPMNRRILYNRASADPAGRPWSERKKYVEWDEAAGEWTGADVPDFKATMRPDYAPEPGAKAEDALSGTQPFIMQEDGVGWLFTPDGVSDAPFPTHYEPQESPYANALYGQQSNPPRRQIDDAQNRYNPSGDDPGADAYPFVLTTYRLTEHHTAGGMSRTLPYLSELQPEMFCEVSPLLARERDLENGGWATIVTARSAIEARVLVTERMRPLRGKGAKRMHQVGLPYHWGWQGLSRGDSANDLLSIVLDPNVSIQESKVATCDIIAGRRPQGAALVALVEEYRRRGSLATTPEHVDG